MLAPCPTDGINHSHGNQHYLHINARMGFPAPLFGRRKETRLNMRVALTLLLLLAAVRAEHRGKGIYQDAWGFALPRGRGV